VILSLFDARVVSNAHIVHVDSAVLKQVECRLGCEGTKNKIERRIRNVYFAFLSFLSVGSIQLPFLLKYKRPLSVLGTPTGSTVESSEHFFIPFQTCIQSICKSQTNLEAAFVCTSNFLTVNDHIAVCNFHFELGQ